MLEENHFVCCENLLCYRLIGNNRSYTIKICPVRHSGANILDNVVEIKGQRGKQRYRGKKKTNTEKRMK